MILTTRFVDDSNSAYFGPFFLLQNSNLAWDLVRQKNLGRDFCKRSVDLSFEGWFKIVSPLFIFRPRVTSDWKTRSTPNRKSPLFFEQCFSSCLVAQMGNRFYYYYVKKGVTNKALKISVGSVRSKPRNWQFNAFSRASCILSGLMLPRPLEHIVWRWFLTAISYWNNEDNLLQLSNELSCPFFILCY